MSDAVKRLILLVVNSLLVASLPAVGDGYQLLVIVCQGMVMGYTLYWFKSVNKGD